MDWLAWLLIIGIVVLYVRASIKEKKQSHTNKFSNSNENDASISEEEKDNWEGFNYYQSVISPASGRYKIKYTDQRDMETEREISVKRVYSDNGKYAIAAHCLLRNAHRSFLNDRIKTAINLDTGEVVGSVANDAIKQFAASDEGIDYQQEKKALVEIQKEWAGISILMFVAKADGQMVKKERDVIASYLRRFCSDTDIRDDILDKMIKQLGAPDQREFKYLVKKMKDSGDIEKLKLLIDSANKIIDTGKTRAPFEKAALDVLELAAN